MYTKNDLMKNIRQLGIKPEDTLMVHSSMKAIGEVEGGAHTVLESLIDSVGDEGLLLFPTHTWKQMGRDYLIFNPLTEPACVGLLPNLFMNCPGVVRSLHPTHSVAARGKDAKRYVADDQYVQTPCPRNGCFGKLYDRGGKILFLGASLKSNTYIHSVEEWYRVPDRLSTDQLDYKVVLPDGTLMPHPLYYHHVSFTTDISHNYDKLEEPFLYHNIAVKGKIGDADCILLDARKAADLAGSFFEKNPLLMNDSAPVPEGWWKFPSP